LKNKHTKVNYPVSYTLTALSVIQTMQNNILKNPNE